MTGRALVTPYRWTDCTWPRTGTRSVLCAEASSAREAGKQPRTIAHAVHSFRMHLPSGTSNLQLPSPNSQRHGALGSWRHWELGVWVYFFAVLAGFGASAFTAVATIELPSM